MSQVKKKCAADSETKTTSIIQHLQYGRNALTVCLLFDLWCVITDLLFDDKDWFICGKAPSHIHKNKSLLLRYNKAFKEAFGNNSEMPIGEFELYS